MLPACLLQVVESGSLISSLEDLIVEKQMVEQILKNIDSTFSMLKKWWKKLQEKLQLSLDFQVLLGLKRFGQNLVKSTSHGY